MAKRNNKNNTRRHGGRRNNSTRKSRGIFSTLYTPVGEGVNVLKNVTGTGLNLVVNLPTNALRGVKGVAKGAVFRVANNINKVGRRATSGVNTAISGVFRSRKNRRSRRASRKSRRAGRR
jgi:hypothetical protein